MEHTKNQSSLLKAALKGASQQFSQNFADNRQQQKSAPPDQIEAAKQRVEECLPSPESHPRVAIIGSVDFYHKDSPALCDAIGKALAERFPHICLTTGGNASTQFRLAGAFQNELTFREKTPNVFHLVPEEYHCDWNFGTFITAGKDMEERRYLLATTSDLYISVEGGPGTVDEMEKAQRAGKIIIPLARTGGASDGMFGAPAIPRPSFVDEATWGFLHDRDASIGDCVNAVLSIVESILEDKRPKGQQTAKLPQSQLWSRQQLSSGNIDAIEKTLGNTLDVTYAQRPKVEGPAYVKATLAGCAHLVFPGSDHSSPAGTVGDIYLGRKAAAGSSRLPELLSVGIKGIVNCTKCFPCHFKDQGIQYCTVAVNDEDGANILVFLDGATTFMHSVLTKGSSILVHCEMGVSRSSTVVIAYLMRFWNMTRDEAYIYVKSRRPRASPNPGFWDQLSRFEKRCRREDSSAQSGEGAPFVTSQEWALQSSALFATCHEAPEILHEATVNQRLSKVADLKSQEEVLSVCLDFIWGRGLLDIDLQWLRFVCDQLDKQKITKSSTLVSNIMRNTESDFGYSWSGEIYEHQILKIENLL